MEKYSQFIEYLKIHEEVQNRGYLHMEEGFSIKSTNAILSIKGHLYVLVTNSIKLNEVSEI